MVDFNTCVETKSGNIRTPKCRLSYVYFESPNPKAKVTSGTHAGKLKYTVSLLIPKAADIGMLKRAAEAAAIEEFGAEKFKAETGIAYRDFEIQNDAQREQALREQLAGAVTATVQIQFSNDGTNWMSHADYTLTLSGTTSDVDAFTEEDAYAYHRASVTAISGTGAAVTVTVGA